MIALLVIMAFLVIGMLSYLFYRGYKLGRGDYDVLPVPANTVPDYSVPAASEEHYSRLFDKAVRTERNGEVLDLS